MINPRLRHQIIQFIVTWPTIDTVSGRRTFLANTGLSESIENIEIEGSSQEFVQRLVYHLDYLMKESNSKRVEEFFHWIEESCKDGRRAQEASRLSMEIRETIQSSSGPKDDETPAQSSTRKAQLKFREHRRMELSRQLEFLESVRKALKDQLHHYAPRFPNEITAEVDFIRDYITELEDNLSSKHHIEFGTAASTEILRIPRPNFIGRSEELHELIPILGPLSQERFILIKGPSGIGKSALAREVASRIVEAGDADDVILVSLPSDTDVANQFDPIDNFVDRLRVQVGVNERRESKGDHRTDKSKEVEEILSGGKNYIIVIDNLQSSVGIGNNLVAFLRVSIPANSKVIITATHHLSEVDFILNLGGMKYAEAALLMRQEAYLKGLKAVAYTDDYKLLRRAWSWASGLPLAMQWLIGYASESALSFTRLLTRFESGEGQDDTLLDRLFQRSFMLIRDDEAKRDTLFALALFETHGILDSISHVSGVRGLILENALSSMYHLSLVQFDDYKDEYTLLPITRRFVIKSAKGTIDLTRFYERAVEYYRSVFGDLDEVNIQSESILLHLSKERQNIIAILDWCMAHDKWESFIDIGLKMNAALGYSGHYPARLKYAYQLLEAAKRFEKPVLQAWILVHEVGWINQHMGNYDEAELMTKQGLAIATEIGDDKSAAQAKRNLGILLYRRAKQEVDPEKRSKEFKEGLRLGQESLESYKALGDLRWQAITIRLLAMIYKEMSQLDESRTQYEEALVLHRQAGDLESESLTISDLGDLAILNGDLPRAKELIQQALTLDEKQGRAFGRGRNRQRLAHIEFKYGHTEAVTRLMREAYDIFQEMGASKAIESLLKDAKRFGVDIG